MQNSDSLSVGSMGQVYTDKLLERMNERFVIDKNLSLSLRERLELLGGSVPEIKTYTFALRTLFTKKQIENRDFPLGLFFDKYWESLENAWDRGTWLSFRIPLMFHADWRDESEHLQCTLRCRIQSFIPPRDVDSLKLEGANYSLAVLNG